MKGFKKLLTGILAATMIMGASITAFAAEANTASITIKNEDNGNTGAIAEIDYTYYQFLKADILSLANDPQSEDGATQTGTAAYYVDNATLAGYLENAKDANGNALFKVTGSSTETRWNVEATDAGKNNAEAIVAALENIIATHDAETIKNAGIKKGTFSNKVGDTVNASATVGGLEPGYYLVLSSLGTKAALQTLGNVEINEKNTYPTVVKEKTTTPIAYSMLGLGSTLSYKIEVAIPANAAKEDIKVVDTATNGLTLELETGKIAVTGAEGLTSLSWTKTEKAGTVGEKAATVYETVIPAAVVEANRGKTVTLAYNAVINENAVVYEAEKNTAHIEYGTYSSAETNPVEVKTLGFKIFKYTLNGTERVAIAGAKFKLYDKNNNEIKVVKVADGHYRVATAAEIEAKQAVEIEVIAEGEQKGYASVDGLEFDTYYLEETVAPTGYNKLTEKQAVIIDSEKNATVENIKVADVLNNSGSVLPSTGGVGTTIFYIIGGILIIAGVAYFLVRRKADAE